VPAWVVTDGSVNRFPHGVGVAEVAGDLLDHVQQDPAHRDVAASLGVDRRELVEFGCAHNGARLIDRFLVEREDPLLRSCSHVRSSPAAAASVDNPRKTRRWLSADAGMPSPKTAARVYAQGALSADRDDLASRARPSERLLGPDSVSELRRTLPI
jgi:hypothetical protein